MTGGVTARSFKLGSSLVVVGGGDLSLPHLETLLFEFVEFGVGGKGSTYASINYPYQNIETRNSQEISQTHVAYPTSLH